MPSQKGNRLRASSWVALSCVVLLSAAGQAEAYEYPASHAPAGPTFHVGGPITVTVEPRNVSGQLRHAIFGSLHSGYQFTIRNEQSGELVPTNPQNKFGQFQGSVSTKDEPVSPGVTSAQPTVFGWVGK